MIFDNLTSPPDKLNGCVDNLTVLPINIFNYFHCHSEKNTTGGHTVVKPGKENKRGAVGGVGAAGGKMQTLRCNMPSYTPGLGDPGVLRHVCKMALPLG